VVLGLVDDVLVVELDVVLELGIVVVGAVDVLVDVVVAITVDVLGGDVVGGIVVDVVGGTVVVGAGGSRQGDADTAGRYRDGFGQASRRMSRALFDTVTTRFPAPSRHGTR
jgi:vacuolar-type H+-ATPase subunit E/Vma4